jgi:hypothetical protein
MELYDHDNFKDELERLKQENQFKRMKLRLEYGADIPLESEHEDLPPEIESQFLDSVAAFEMAYRQAEQIQVYDFIGKPKCRRTDSIPDSEIRLELDQILEVLNKNQIGIDTLCTVDARVLYRFITEELFFIETDNIRIDGMINHFVYEEFHPNHEYDITNNCTWFFESFLNKDTDLYASYLTEEQGTNTWYENFRNSFHSFNQTDFTISAIQFGDQTASVKFNIIFSGIIENSDEIAYFNGDGEIEMLLISESWFIQKITLPLSPE